MFPKQFDVFNVAITEPPPGTLFITPAVLCSGGRMTGKTIAICNRIMRHLWETPGARAAIFAKTMKVAKDGGIWEDIMDAVREWVASGIVGKTGLPFEYTTTDSRGNPGPRLDSQTRTIAFKVRNYWGGESELKLFSLEHDHEVEAKVKSTRFSLMWFSELSLFGDRRVFDVSTLQLRMKHLKPWQHLWIADTNPHEDGTEHWIYKIWYVDRLKDETVIRSELEKKGHSGERLEREVKNKIAYRDSLRLVEILLDDNKFLDDGDRVKLISQYEDDPGEFARNVEGKWVKGHGNIGRHFADLFHEATHVIGSDDPNVGDSIDVAPDSFELVTGWDTGDVNHSAHILERRLINGRAHWMVHDENVVIDGQITTGEFALEMLGKMDELERFYSRMFVWQHWSDDSAMVWRSSGEGSTDALDIEAATGGKVTLQPVLKPKYSVRARVKLIRLLLRQHRIFVARRCTHTIDMFYNLSRGTTETEYVLGNRFKHPFDSLSYPIYMETLKDPDPEFALAPRPKAVDRGLIYA